MNPMKHLVISSCKGSKDIQMVDLSDIVTTKNGKYDWKNSLNRNVKYIVGQECGNIKLIDYKYFNDSQTSRILIECKNQLSWIHPLMLKRSNISVITGKTNKDFIYDVGDNISVGANTFLVLDRKIDGRKKYLLKCNGCGEISWKTQNSLLTCKSNVKLCSVCSNFKYKKGVNDIPTIADWMIPYFEAGFIEAEKHTPFENYEFYPICPKCQKKSERKYRISIIYRDHGFKCICKSNKSYGENLLKEVLLQNNIDFINDKKLRWSLNKRYDFVIEKDKLIIEVDGDYGHGAFRKGKEYSESLKEIEIDALKNRMAKEHGFHVIRLKYISKKRDEFINEIKNKLPKKYWVNTDWELAKKNIFSLNKKAICLEYESSNKDRKDIIHLAEKYNFCENTIRNILRVGNTLGWCVYPKTKNMRVRK